MANTLLIAASFLLASLVSLASALPNVTAVQIGGGTCAEFPSGFHGAGDSADAFIFQADQADNSSVNGLKAGIYGSNLVIYGNNTGTTSIFCCDYGGNIEDGFGVKSLLLSPNANDQGLAYLTQGTKPETYAHEINGVRQEGVFLGKANVTTWGFRHAVNASSDYYQVRLLTPGSAQSLYDGEFKGFLKILIPVIS